MKIKIKENSISLNELKRDLEEEFGDTYKVSVYGKRRVTLAKNKIVGAVVTLRKNEIIAVGTFPVPWVYGVFVFTMVFTGILIPLVLYFIFFHKKMNQCDKEVGAFVRENYEKSLLTYPKEYLGVDA